MRISAQHFDYISTLARDNSAIVIEPGKEYLVETRLGPIARREGFNTLEGFIEHLQSQKSIGTFHHQAIEALTTNETLFFRDFHPFESLEHNILPELLIRRSTDRTITVWSAACSTGQEPYSLAMLLREKFPQLDRWNVKIIATDLSNSVLEKAKDGLYSQIEVNRGLPLPLLAKYFEKDENGWRIKKEIRSMVEFRPLNLIRQWPQMPKFDLILLRNVLIYFDVETKRRILSEVRRSMHPSGALFLGASETTVNIDPTWEIVNHGRSVFYRPKSGLPTVTLSGKN